MKHTNQGDSGRNQTDKDQHRKAQAGNQGESMSQQNKQGKKDHSGKHGNDQSDWQSNKKENKR